METKLQIKKWGNSKAIRLVNSLLEASGLENAENLVAEASEHKIILSLPENGDDGSLAYLFKDFEDDGIRDELVDFGESVGNEFW